MKRLITLLLILLTTVASCFPQESVKPTLDAEIVRRVAAMDIEGKYYYSVVVTLKSNSPDFVFINKSKVKVTIKDIRGTTIYKRTFKKAFMYLFSNGQVQVGRPTYDQLLITKSSDSGDFVGMIREKEGVY